MISYIQFNNKGGVIVARDLTRITLNLSTKLVEQLDAYADEMGLVRTSAISVLLSQALNSQKAMQDIGELLKLVKEEQNKSE